MDKPQKDGIPDRLYRFRPLTVVKPSIVEGKAIPGKTVVEELESQEIFVARLDELNDPMDGLHHTVWDGDSIVWENFIRSYSRRRYTSRAADTGTTSRSAHATRNTGRWSQSGKIPP